MPVYGYDETDQTTDDVSICPFRRRGYRREDRHLAIIRHLAERAVRG
jgi:hypothetical protein